MKRYLPLLLVLGCQTPATKSDARCFLPGDRIDPSVTVEDAEGKSVTLGDVVSSAGEVKAVVLYIMGGAEGPKDKPGSPHRGGIWCEDTFNDLSIARHLIVQYGDRGVLFIGIACPPVYHEARLGYDEGAFLTRGDNDLIFRENRADFVEGTLRLKEAGLIPFEQLYFDTRFRLMSNPKLGEANEETGDRPWWQGRFKWHGDSQMYGVPTIWVLRPDLTVFGDPYFMNVYETRGAPLRYSGMDVAERLDRLVR